MFGFISGRKCLYLLCMSSSGKEVEEYKQRNKKKGDDYVELTYCGKTISFVCYPI